MGWDSYASRWPQLDDNGDALNAEDIAAFENGANQIANIDLVPDGYLRQGGLDCSACARAIEAATGVDMYTTRRISPDEIPAMLARWDDSRLDNTPGFNMSAKIFLEICAARGLYVHTTY